jgi:hypothetical protein
MKESTLKQREVYGVAWHTHVTFWFTVDTPDMRMKHWSMISEFVMETIRAHEAMDTGYPFVAGMSGYTRLGALLFMRRLAQHIDESRRQGNSEYVIEWWRRETSDTGKGPLIYSIAPPGIYELST